MRAVVAMSGGVDSSVAAGLLVQQGWDVIGVTLRLWDCDAPETAKSCCGVDAVAAARGVADKLGIPHYSKDCRDEFVEAVLRPSWDEYDRGRTPNPCIPCNESIKFGLLAEMARDLGATHVATGHHAKIGHDAEGRPFVARGHDRDKDQSYFLVHLTRELLEHALFPVGELTKDRVREIARELGLPNAERTESQDACLMIGGEGFAEALRRRFEGAARPGEIVDPAGRCLGRHEGIHRYTIGQRRGLGVALGKRAFVSEIDGEGHRVILTTDERRLFAAAMAVCGVRWTSGAAPDVGSVSVQIRYRHRAVPCAIEIDGERVVARFEEPQRAVAPGQAAVFYDGERLLGGGWIDRALWNGEADGPDR